MHKGLRRTGRLAVATGLVLLGALSPVRGVDALENEKVSYDPTSGEPYSYHADVVMAPTDGGTFTDVDTCIAVTWCTMVPLDITPLDRGDDGDWIVQVDTRWNDDKVETPDNVGGSQQANDLDVYLYYWGTLTNEDGTPQVDENGKPVEGYIESGRSAGGKSPEIIKLFRPTEREYFLVVINFVGLNQGFDIDFTYTDASFGGVGEFFNDKPSATAAAPSNGTSNRLSYGDQPSKPFTAPPPPAAPASAPVAFHDSDFGFASAVPDDLLESDEGPVRGSLFAEEVKAPPADVSSTTLFLWLGLLPLLLTAGAAAYFVKSRPSALSIRFPARRAAVAAEPAAE